MATYPNVNAANQYARDAAIDYTCTVENITATAFRTDSSSFS